VSHASSKACIFLARQQGRTLSAVTQGARFVIRVDTGKRVLNSKLGYRYLRPLERYYEHWAWYPIQGNRQFSPPTGRNCRRRAGRALSPEQR
jgi:hypothetical protein